MDSIFQSKQWEEFKLKMGYRKSYWIDGILVLQKSLPFGRSMLYSPMVSETLLRRILNNELRIKREFLDSIKSIARKNSSIFFRMEFDAPVAIQDSRFKIQDAGLVKAFEHMQPENTWILDLSKTEEELLAQMSMRCRYNVRLAKKSGVTVTSSRADKEMINNFYNLYSITGKRHGITFRAKSYFETLLEILGKEDYARIYEAAFWQEKKAVILCSGILIFSGEKAIYMFGASSNDHRNLKAPNLMVWQMILDAKKHGCKQFDFYGIAPDNDPNHPWAGITSFKKQFGGYQADILGSYDMIIKPLEYKMFKIAEKTRRH